ncbi:MAG: cytochrome P450 [Byssovorax sp.]
MRLPPGLRRPAIVQLIEWLHDPIGLMSRLGERFGDIFTVRLAGFGTLVLVSSPELVKQVLTADPETVRAGEAQSFIRFALGPRSPLVIDGQEHLRQRRLLLPPFHGERMTAYSHDICETTRQYMTRWPVGSPFEMLPAMRAITLDVMLRAVFGLSHGPQMDELRDLLLQFSGAASSGLFFIRALQEDRPLNPFKSFFRLRDTLDRVIYKLIAERRRARDLDVRQDILSVLSRTRDEEGRPISDEELRDQLLTLVAAGYETTSSTLAWVFDDILRSPEVAEKVHAEVREASPNGDFDARAVKLEYLDATIKETLRMRPVSPVASRRLGAPFSLGGYALEPGQIVAISIPLVHRRPELYPDPDRFSPERFLGVKPNPYQWVPFGGGVRRCIGMAFALHETKLIVATVLSRLRLRLAQGAPQRPAYRGVLVSPSAGTPVIITEAS